MLEVLYEDLEIIVVRKPVGIESQSSRGFSADMVSEIKKHIHILSPKSGEPYVGVVHRLDKPVSGIMVYGKTKNAAAKLSKQVAQRQMTKRYLAILCGKPVENVDKYVDYLLKDEKSNQSTIVDKGITGAKLATLEYRILETTEKEPFGELTLVEITLFTGRHHQIRVQMAAHGFPLLGDGKYNPVTGGHTHGRQIGLALSAYELTFVHPTTGKEMTFSQIPGETIFQQFSYCSKSIWR